MQLDLPLARPLSACYCGKQHLSLDDATHVRCGIALCTCACLEIFNADQERIKQMQQGNMARAYEAAVTRRVA